MTTAYTTLLGLALPVTGELSGTWGDTVNNAITGLLDTAVAGTTTLSSDSDVTLSTTTGAANQARQAIILWTAGGTVTRTITAPAQSKTYIVLNKTSSTQSIKLVGVGPTTGVTIVANELALCAWNGTDFVKIANQYGASNVTSLTATANSSFTSTGALLISKGTTGEQPGSPVTGMMRYNSTTNQFEGYSGSSPAWKSIGGSALSNDTSTASSLYPVFAGATSGTAENLYTSNAKLLYKPSTGELQASVPVASNGIVVNSLTVTASYTIASGFSGASAGPITLASGVVVTVAGGSRWVIS
jgi:hypothetical protein